MWGGLVTENVTQALARDVIAQHTLEVEKKHYDVKLMCHDSLVFVIKNEEVAEASEVIAKIMRTPPTWGSDIPLDVEIGVGDNYGDLDVIQI